MVPADGSPVFGGRSLAFTFEGLVIGSVLYSMPFVVQPIRNAFEAFGERPLEVAATLRARPLDAFWTVAIPLAGPASSLARCWDLPTQSENSALF